MKKLAIIGGSILFGGIVLFIVSMSLLEWDFTKLSTKDPLHEQSYTLQNNNQDIIINEENIDIIVQPSMDDDIHFVYYENEFEYYDIEKVDENIKFSKQDDSLWYHDLITIDFSDYKFELYLPLDYTGNLTLSTTNDRIDIKNVNFGELNATTTNDDITLNNITAQSIIASTTNDDIELSKLQITNNIEIQTTYGDITLDNITAQSIIASTTNENINSKDIELTENFDVETNNGDITLDNITAQNITASTTNDDIEVKKIDGTKISLETNNGDVSGSILGKEEEFNIIANTTLGDNNLSSNFEEGAEKRIDIEIENGDIEVVFELD